MIKMNLLTNDKVVVNLRYFHLSSTSRDVDDDDCISSLHLKEIFDDVSDKGKKPIYYNIYRPIFKDEVYCIISDQPLVKDDMKNILEDCDKRCSTCEEYYNHCEGIISDEEREQLIERHRKESL